eukprot:6829717-Lingulodinium_polyedra.AAC.1
MASAFGVCGSTCAVTVSPMDLRSVVTVSVESTIPPADHIAVEMPFSPLSPCTEGFATSHAAPVSSAHSSKPEALTWQIATILGGSLGACGRAEGCAETATATVSGFVAGAPNAIAFWSPLVGGVEKCLKMHFSPYLH